jgi:hypothetical protein
LEEEIDLKELITIWWKGKYFIIAVTIIAMVIALVGSILFVTPLYRASASIVTDTYNGWIREIIDHPDEKSFIDNSLAEIVIDPNNYIDSVTLDYNDETVSIIAIATDPNLAAEAANKIGLDLLEWLKGYELEKLLLEKREIEDTLVFFIEQLNIVMLEMDGNSEELNQYDVTADFVDTAIDIINEKYGEPQIDILEILIDRKASLQNDLLETSIEISIIKNRTINEDIEQYFYPSSIPQQPYNNRLVTNTFIAGILGLMLSTLIVFIRSHFGVAKGKTR